MPMACACWQKKCPKMLIAASCSKNFGLYRERTGIILAIASDPTNTKLVQGNLASINRLNFSFPPDHGAALVNIVLNDADLRQQWMDELESMRLSMLNARTALADALQSGLNSDRFGFIKQHRGMFSRIGIERQQVDRIREEFGIYMLGDSRINIAGVTENKVDQIAQAIIATSD